MRKKLIAGLFMAGLAFFMAASASAAQLVLPEDAKPGELFVATIRPANDDKQIGLTFDARQIQFMGSLQGTPDVQIRSESEIEIKPSGAKFADSYGLKFLSLLASGSSVVKIADAGGSREQLVTFNPVTVSRGYSWLILAGGLILMILGIRVWRFQKSAPGMMSTKSLFMNFEELDKARQQNSSDGDGAGNATAGSSAGQDSEPPAAKIDANQTLKHPSVKEPVAVPEEKKPEIRQTGGRLVFSIEGNGRVYEAEGELIRIGRRRENEIPISASEISRDHVEVVLIKGLVNIRPLTESNITRLNGRTVKDYQLIRAGDTLNLGGTDFVVIKARAL